MTAFLSEQRRRNQVLLNLREPVHPLRVSSQGNRSAHNQANPLTQAVTHISRPPFSVQELEIHHRQAIEQPILPVINRLLSPSTSRPSSPRTRNRSESRTSSHYSGFEPRNRHQLQDQQYSRSLHITSTSIGTKCPADCCRTILRSLLEGAQNAARPWRASYEAPDGLVESSSPKLPLPTSLDEIRPQKQQPTVVDQPPVTPTLSYSSSSPNSSPTTTYVEEVSPVKVTPTLHSQHNQPEPFTCMQKSVVQSLIENYTTVACP